jgi:hypothetical protein
VDCEIHRGSGSKGRRVVVAGCSSGPKGRKSLEGTPLLKLRHSNHGSQSIGRTTRGRREIAYISLPCEIRTGSRLGYASRGPRKVFNVLGSKMMVPALSPPPTPTIQDPCFECAATKDMPGSEMKPVRPATVRMRGGSSPPAAVRLSRAIYCVV